MSNLTTLDDLHDDEETVEVQNTGEDSSIESPRAGTAEKEVRTRYLLVVGPLCPDHLAILSTP